MLRDGEVVGSVPHTPQYRVQRFRYDDVFNKSQLTGTHDYSVRAVDAAGATADSAAPAADLRTAA